MAAGDPRKRVPNTIAVIFIRLPYRTHALLVYILYAVCYAQKKIKIKKYPQILNARTSDNRRPTIQYNKTFDGVVRRPR